MYDTILKRGIDLIISIILIFLLSPVFYFISILVRIKLGKGLFFIQKRPGLNEKIFKMYKFRTMINLLDENGELPLDSERLNSFGQFLRKTSLDELPELFNVLKGDVSFVGPRPLLVEYLPLYNEEQRKRHNVKPGITGWAQVNGRNAISWEEKFELDVWYVENWSIWLDIKILLLTLVKVIRREGINQKNQ